MQANVIMTNYYLIILHNFSILKLQVIPNLAISWSAMMELLIYSRIWIFQFRLLPRTVVYQDSGDVILYCQSTLHVFSCILHVFSPVFCMFFLYSACFFLYSACLSCIRHVFHFFPFRFVINLAPTRSLKMLTIFLQN